jgi:fructokinase
MYVPGFEVKSIVTTGAGDAFAGVVLYQLSSFDFSQIKQLETEDWQTIFFKANKAGAETCEYIGVMKAFKQLTSEIFS